MKKEDIILKKGDKVYYTDIWGKKNNLVVVDVYVGATIKKFEEYVGKITKIERLETIYEAPKEILDKEEKEYLEAVLRPFRNKNVIIIKTGFIVDGWQLEFIKIYIGCHDIKLPSFDKGTMYKGMKPNKEYTLAELGLFEGEEV